MRVLLRVLAPLLGLAVAVVGVLVVLEVVAAWVRPDAASGLVVPWQDWYAAIGRVSWDDPAVTVAAVAVGLLGILFLLVGMLARRHEIPVTGPAPEIVVTTSPRVLARLVGRRVRSAEDVADASVTASRRRVSVAAEAWTEAPAGLAGVIRGRVEDLLDEVPLQRRPRVAVSVHDRRGLR